MVIYVRDDLHSCTQDDAVYRAAVETRFVRLNNAAYTDIHLGSKVRTAGERKRRGYWKNAIYPDGCSCELRGKPTTILLLCAHAKAQDGNRVRSPAVVHGYNNIIAIT